MIKFKSSKGQGWTIDYVVSFLIFMIAGVLAVKLLSNTFVSDEFDNVQTEAILISDYVLSPGTPSKWNQDNVILLGLASSKNRISNAKSENLYYLNYSTAKNRFGVRYDYAFYLEDKNATVISIRDRCSLGSPELVSSKNLYQEIRPNAYYFKDESIMSGWMTTFGADFYDGNNNNDVDLFYESLENYDLILLENPELSDGGSLTNKEKEDRLATYVSNGGVIFASENVSINLSGASPTQSINYHADVLSVQDDYFQLTGGANINDLDLTDQSYTIVNLNGTGFTNLAAYTANGDPWHARWNYGIGKVYYSATYNGQYTFGPTEFRDKVGEALNEFINVTRANCTGFNFQGINSQNIVRIERLAVYDSEIIKVNVISWS